MSASTDNDLYFPVRRDAKRVDPVPMGQFLAVVAIGVPFWATLVMPLTISYQLGKALVGLVVPKKIREPPSKFDSGYNVSESEILPLPRRKYDIVVLGATGFAGSLSIRHLARTYGVNKNVKWAIAGRSKDKLENIKKHWAKELGMPEIEQVDVIVADTSISSTMPNLVRDTRAVVSFAGPYSQYGNSVVEFCSKFGTHYTDITGEADWVRLMIRTWQVTAKRTGAKIISFCGHDSIPWDLSFYKMAETLKKKSDEELVSVTFHDDVTGAPSGGTIATIDLAVNNAGPSDSKLDPFRNTASGSLNMNSPLSDNNPWFISKVTKPWDRKQAYSAPFIMSALNIQVAGWTQSLRGGAKTSYREHRILPDFKTAFVDFFGILVFMTGLMNPVTSTLMFKSGIIPRPGSGPSMDDMENKFYLSVYGQGIGNKGTKVESIVYFPHDACYMETSRMAVEAALAIVLEEVKLPISGGGFFSPAFGLGDVLLRRLTETGTHFAMK